MMLEIKRFTRTICVTRFIHKMTLLVVMFAVAGCVYMMESVLFLNVEVFGVNDSVGERIRVFSVENVELIFKNWFSLSMRRPSSLSIHACSLESKSVARFDTLH